MRNLLSFFLVYFSLLNPSFAKIIYVGKQETYKQIKPAIQFAQPYDTIVIGKGFYQEGNILVTKPLTIQGVGMPILDGHKKYEVLSIKSSYVTIQGLRIQHSGFATLDDPGGIKVYDSQHVTICNNELFDNFFGIYIQYSRNCLIKNNRIVAFGKQEEQIGNGIHCWKSDSLQIIGNDISGNRDGIYFEFVTHSIIWRNISYNNIRYGLHFMFSNDDAYITNYFRNNGAGVAVMFTQHVKMFNNHFEDNWGDAAYGLLLKEISDAYIFGNIFNANTIGIFMDGTNRIEVNKNRFISNGWAMKIQASCMDNTISDNNFLGNTFDVGTNGSLMLNTFATNYWDKYEGYDLDRNGTGDVPYHPLSLFSVIVEQNPSTMLLFRSFITTLLDRSEKMIPSLTPDNFIDLQPRMRAIHYD